MSRRRRTVSALLSDDSNNEEITTTRTPRKSRAVSRILNEESEGPTSVTRSYGRRLVRCDCSKCNGNLVDIRTKVIHEIEENSADDQDSEVVQDTPLSSLEEPSLEDNPISHDENSGDDDEAVIQRM